MPAVIMQIEITAALLREVAAASSTDPRTCQKLLREGPNAVSPMPRQRIMQTLDQRGLLHLLPAEAPGGVR